MLRKDYLLWVRTWRRMSVEILFPVLIFVVLAVIRSTIPVKKLSVDRDLTRYMTSLGPLAQPERMGVGSWESEEQLFKEGSPLRMKDNQYIVASLLDYKNNEEWYKFHGLPDDMSKTMNPWARWIGDNCEETKYNKERKKWAIIGDVEKSQMTREIMEDVRDYHYMKSRFRNSTLEWWAVNEAQFREQNGGNTPENPLENLLGIWSRLDAEPLVFRDEAEFYSYIYDPQYEKVNEFNYQEIPGICLGIIVDENISNEDTPREEQKVKIEILVESTRGQTPSHGSLKNDATT